MKQIILITAMLLSAASINAQTTSEKPKKTKEIVFLQEQFNRFYYKAEILKWTFIRQKWCSIIPMVSP